MEDTKKHLTWFKRHIRLGNVKSPSDTVYWKIKTTEGVGWRCRALGIEIISSKSYVASSFLKSNGVPCRHYGEICELLIPTELENALLDYIFKLRKKSLI